MWTLHPLGVSFIIILLYNKTRVTPWGIRAKLEMTASMYVLLLVIFYFILSNNNCYTCLWHWSFIASFHIQ